MHPVLFTIPFIEKDIHTYGVMIALAAMLVAHFSTRLATKKNLPPELFNDLVFWVLLIGIIGARLEYMRVSWDQFEGNLGQGFKIWEGGLVFYGGMISGLVAYWAVCKAKKVPMLTTVDIVVPYIPFGHALGRLGCFAAGCCYGMPAGESVNIRSWTFTPPTIVPVTFPDGSIAPANIALHPAQIYEAIFLTLLGFFLLWLRRRQKFNGQMLLAYLSIYPILRSINEFFRGDGERGFFMEETLGQTISNAQFISLLVVAGAVVGWKILGARAKRSSQ